MLDDDPLMINLGLGNFLNFLRTYRDMVRFLTLVVKFNRVTPVKVTIK
jgi:hypothetical protein